MWDVLLKGFYQYLLLERGLSDHTIDAYMRDIDKLRQYSESLSTPISPKQMVLKDLDNFVIWLNDFGLSAFSQSRIISGVKAFFKYLLVEDLIMDDPTELMDAPRLRRKIPDVLTYSEIEDILNHMDMTLPHATRNRAIIETLYACGIRVSELIELRISNYFPDQGYIKVIGKGDKERIVPIAPDAIHHIELYKDHERVHLDVKKGYEDHLFLNRRGRKLTRNMIFLIVKKAVEIAGLKKTVSPHTFRHSFATHLVEGGADLRVVQDMLGHQSITTTEIYTHLDRDYLKDTIERYHPKGSLR